jgi:hypothetical protein
LWLPSASITRLVSLPGAPQLLDRRQGQVLTKRLTLITIDGVIEECLYPVFPPDADAANVEAWVHSRILAPLLPAAVCL